MIGTFATSKAGRDKSQLYIIIKEDSEYVYLVDGIHRTIERPKKKKIKHIQIIHKQVVDELQKRIDEGLSISNEQLKRAIKLYRENLDIGGL